MYVISDDVASEGVQAPSTYLRSRRYGPRFLNVKQSEARSENVVCLFEMFS